MPEKKEEELFAKQDEKADPFAEQAPVEPKVEEAEEDVEEVKNRRFRRMEAKYQAERESSIALAARLQAMSEVQKFRQETGADDVDQTIARIYGTNTPEAAEATKLLQQALSKSTEKAVEKAMEKFNERIDEDNKELAQEEETVQSFIDTIEDEYGVDLSSKKGEKLRAGFLDQLERLSFKRNGEIVEYADPIETWEVYSQLNKPSTSRAKELGSRSMTRSGSSSEFSEANANEQYLKENDLI